MQTITFQIVLAALLGRLSNANKLTDVASFPADKVARIDSCINAAYRYGWRYHRSGWPEQVNFDHPAVQTQPVTNYRWLQYNDSVPKLFSDGVFDIYTADPRLQPARSVDFTIGTDGFYFSTAPGRSAPDHVWVRWRAPEGRFSCKAYDNGTTYVVDDVVLYTDGNCYRAIQAGSGHAPTNTSYWAPQTFMALLEQAVIAGAAGLLAKNLSEYEVAASLQQDMRDLLDMEITQLADQCGYINFGKR